MLLLANGNGPFVSIKKRIRKGIIKKIKALALEWFFLENCFSFLWDRKPKPFKGWCSQENGPHSSLSTALRDNGTPAARPSHQSKFSRGRGAFFKRLPFPSPVLLFLQHLHRLVRDRAGQHPGEAAGIGAVVAVAVLTGKVQGNVGVLGGGEGPRRCGRT